MDSDSDFYGDAEEVANLESRVEDFDVGAYWQKRGKPGMAKPSSSIKQESPSSEDIMSTTTTTTTTTNLHNPYESRVSAKQLGETVDEFLARLPPATTDVTEDIPWIYVANPFIPRDDRGGEEAPEEFGAQVQTFTVGGMERLHMFSGFLEGVNKAKRGGVSSAAVNSEVFKQRDGCVNDILMLARALKVRTGKWMLFIDPAFVNDVWDTVVRATVKNELGIAAKVAPREQRGSTKERLVCIYTYDFADKDDLARVLNRMRQLELVHNGGKLIYYKADAYTHLGLGSGNTWGIRASLYSSKDMFAHLKEKEGKTPKKKVKEEGEEEDGGNWTF